ncbi:MAG: hypothetical protein EOP08_17085, partial [Proteobacteria bacterium]
FNDFFTRRLAPGARPLDTAPGRLVSPADGRVFAYTDVRGGSGGSTGSGRRGG